MFIIFGGWGLLVFPFAAIAVVAGGFIAQNLQLKDGPMLLMVAGVFACLCISAGILLKNIGQRRNHIFFIPLEWWGIAAMVGTGALVFAANEFPSNSAQAGPDAATAAPLGGVTATTEPVTPACVQPDNSQVRVFCWTRFIDKDPMTDKTREKIVSEVLFPDGTDVEAEVKSEGVTIDFFIRTFHKDKPNPFNVSDQQTTPLRVRVDSGDARIAVAQLQHPNDVFIFFYSPAGLRSYLGTDDNSKPSPNSDSGGSFFGSMLSWAIAIPVAKFIGMAAGQVDELVAAQHVLVELPLSDGSTNVVDLNPSDPVLKQFMVSSIAPLHSRPAVTKKPSARPAVQTAESSDESVQQPAVPRTPPKKKAHKICTTINNTRVCE